MLSFLKKKEPIELIEKIEYEYQKAKKNKKYKKHFIKAFSLYLREKEKIINDFKIKYKYCFIDKIFKNLEEELIYQKRKIEEGSFNIKNFNLDEFIKKEIVLILSVKNTLSCEEIYSLFIKGENRNMEKMFITALI